MQSRSRLKVGETQSRMHFHRLKSGVSVGKDLPTLPETSSVDRPLRLTPEAILIV